MSDRDRTIFYEEISICSKYEYEDETEIQNVFNEIKHIQLPDKFLNRHVDIDEDNPTDSEIYFGQTGEESPEDAENRFEIDVNDSGEIHIHPYLDSNSIESGKKLFDKITSHVREGTVKVSVLEGVTPGNYKNLAFPKFSDSEKDMTGLRFRYEGSNFLFQDIPLTTSEGDTDEDPEELEEEQVPNDPEEEEEGVFGDIDRAIYFRLAKEDHQTIGSGNTFIEGVLDTYERYLDEFLEQ